MVASLTDSLTGGTISRLDFLKRAEYKYGNRSPMQKAIVCSNVKLT